VSYDGNADLQPSSITTTLNLHTPTVLTYTGPTVVASGQPVQLTGVLAEDTLAPIAGRTLTFSLGSDASAQTCSGVTDATGTAACAVTPNQPLGANSARADFAGDAVYLGSSTSAAIIIFAFLDHGAMVLGDDASAVGTSVTYWGSQWAGDQLSDSPPPNSFKGFASGTSQPPSCGSGWSTETGASSTPPDTVPSYMGVVVASSIGQSGSTITGNTIAIVVVKTDPGYVPNAGHAGTGVVVAVFCHS